MVAGEVESTLEELAGALAKALRGLGRSGGVWGGGGLWRLMPKRAPVRVVVVGPVGDGDVPAWSGRAAQIFFEEPPELFAEDRVLKVCNLAQDSARKGVAYRLQNQWVLGLPVADALENMILRSTYGHDHVFTRQMAWLGSVGPSPLCWLAWL